MTATSDEKKVFLYTDDVENRAEYLAKKLYDLFVCQNDEENEIYEYDFSKVLESNVFLLIDQRHYLLLNKNLLKEFYIYWRSILLKFSTNSSPLKQAEYEINNDYRTNCADLASFCVLIVNPNLASAWSYRKQLLLDRLKSASVEAGDVKTVKIDELFTNELNLGRLILMKYFKSEQTFIHRRWLFRNYLLHPASMISNVRREHLVKSEIDFLIDKLVPKIKSNYYCWSFLNWLLAQNVLSEDFKLQLLKNRYENLIYLNPSDNCIFHSRLNLIMNHLEKSKCNDELIRNEFYFMDDLLARYPYFLTIWNYRKYFLMFLKSINSIQIVDANQLNDERLIKTLSDLLFQNKSNVDLKDELRAVSIDEREKKYSRLILEHQKFNDNERWPSIEFHSVKYFEFLNKFVF